MRRLSLLVTILVVASALAVAPMAGARPASADATTVSLDGTETAENGTAPGAQLAGVVGVERATVEGEVESGAFERQAARAGSDSGRATVVAAQFDESRAELANLERRRAELRTALANGTLTSGEYRARIATLAAETEAIERVLASDRAVAATIPASMLDARGVSEATLAALGERARELRNGEVADIRRDVAGTPEGASPNGAATERSDTGHGNADTERQGDSQSTPAAPGDSGAPGNASTGSSGPGTPAGPDVSDHSANNSMAPANSQNPGNGTGGGPPGAPPFADGERFELREEGL